MNNEKDDRLAKVVAKEAFLWGDNAASKYHQPAAARLDDEWKRVIWPLLSKHAIDMSKTADFACGYGRNARKLKEFGAGEITLIDVNPDNIAYCEANLVPLGGYRTFKNNGYDLNGLPSEEFTFIYSFDAMVHFDLEIIISYIAEFGRVLKPAGMAFIHHSNYTGNPGGSFQTNPHWRNFMSALIFRHVAIRNGFEVLQQEILAWGGTEDIHCIDCITVMRKGEGVLHGAAWSPLQS